MKQNRSFSLLIFCSLWQIMRSPQGVSDGDRVLR